jgi:hypothetical protein
MAKDLNESNCIEKINFKCQWGHWPLLLMGENVTTLALGSRPKQGLARVWTKSEARESHFMLQGSWKCKKVSENEHSHSQVNSHFGSWNLGGLSNLQRAIARVKTHWIQEFLISLETFMWNIIIHFQVWHKLY